MYLPSNKLQGITDSEDMTFIATAA